MADDLTIKEINEQLKNNLVYTQQAMRERDEAVSKLKGMRNLTSVLHATRENLHSYKDKSDTYELLLLRDESHIKKLKQLVTEKEKYILKLETALKNCGGKVDDDIETDGAGPETDKPTFSSKESGYQSVDDEYSIYGRPSAEKSSVYGISHEIYDQLLRDHIQLKKELDNLIKKGDIKPTEYLQAEENEKLINQLELSNKELEKKVQELEKGVQELNDVVKSGPVSDKSKVLELSSQLKSLHEKYHKQELLLKLMEEKCQELARKLLEQSLRQRGRSVESKSDSKEDIKAKSSTDSDKATNHHGAGSTDLPLDQQLKDLEYRNSALANHFQHSQQQNQELSEKFKSAEKKSQIYEQRYHELLRTFQEIKATEVGTKCEKCLVKDEAIETLKQQTEHLNAQLSVFQEDEKHTRQEISNIKKKHELEIDQWARNYSTLSDELEKMKHTLIAQKQHYEHQIRSRMQPVLEPYQSRRPDSMDMGRRRPVDVCDEEPATSKRHQNPAPPLQRTARLQDTAQFIDMLECPRCRREFPPSQQREHAIHVNRCLDD